MKLVLLCLVVSVLALGDARAPAFGVGRVPQSTRAYGSRQPSRYAPRPTNARSYADPGPFGSDPSNNEDAFAGPADMGNDAQFDNPYSGQAPGYPNSRAPVDPYMSEFAERSATYSRHASRNRFRSMAGAGLGSDEDVMQGEDGGAGAEAGGDVGAPGEEEVQPPEAAPPGEAAEAPSVESTGAQAAASAIPAGLAPATIQRDEAFSDSLPKLRAEPVLARDDAPKKRDEPDLDLEGDDEDSKKLNAAMDAVNEDLMVKVNQIKDADSWEKELASVLEVYSKKMDTVRRNLGKAKDEVNNLYKKKKQLENLKIQKGLEAKLRTANSELTELQEAIQNVKSKETEFDKSKTAIANSIASLETQIKTLKGESGDDKPADSSKPADAAAKPADAAAAAKPTEADKAKFAEVKAGTHTKSKRRLDVSAEELDDTRKKLEKVRELIREQKEKIRKVEAEEFERAKRARHFRDRFTPNN